MLQQKYLFILIFVTTFSPLAEAGKSPEHLALKEAPKHVEQGGKSEVSPMSVDPVASKPVGNPWKNFLAKIEHLRSLEAKYEALLQEHEKLKKEYFVLENQLDSLRAQSESTHLAEENLRLTGSPVGRSPASVDYKVPEGLDHEQRYALAFDHMRERRYGAAAVSFESFLHEPEGAAYQTANAFYTAGVAWFQLDNFNKARAYFDIALQKAEGDEKAKIRHKVELWMRVIEKKGKGDGSHK